MTGSLVHNRGDVTVFRLHRQAPGVGAAQMISFFLGRWRSIPTGTPSTEGGSGEYGVVVIVYCVLLVPLVVD